MKPTYDELVDLLQELRDRKFRYPNSDLHEYCSCGRSPYSVPQHRDDCLTVKLNNMLKRIDSSSESKPTAGVSPSWVLCQLAGNHDKAYDTMRKALISEGYDV